MYGIMPMYDINNPSSFTWEIGISEPEVQATFYKAAILYPSIQWVKRKESFCFLYLGVRVGGLNKAEHLVQCLILRDGVVAVGVGWEHWWVQVVFNVEHQGCLPSLWGSAAILHLRVQLYKVS